VRRGKKATALVDVRSQEFGTAFCIESGGYFLTNAHVVERAASGGTLSLVLEPGETTQRVVQARVIRSDKNFDLALLQVDKPAGLVALELGATDDLIETANVT